MGGSPSRVFPKLIMGGFDVCSNVDFFRKNNITHVVSVCDRAPVDAVRAKRLHIALPDFPSTDLSAHFEQIALFIHEARLGDGQVYVHCAAGISRSSTSVLSYLMSWLDVSFDKGLSILRRGREAVRPNLGFRNQLQEARKRGTLAEIGALLRDEERFPGAAALLKADLRCVADKATAQEPFYFSQQQESAEASDEDSEPSGQPPPRSLGQRLSAPFRQWKDKQERKKTQELIGEDPLPQPPDPTAAASRGPVLRAEPIREIQEASDEDEESTAEAPVDAASAAAAAPVGGGNKP